MVGAGGTGSYVLPMLLETYEQSRSQVKDIVCVIDGDILEERNLNRQAFYLDDIGLNKAEALVKHYQDAELNTQIVYSKDFITTMSHLIKLVKVILSFKTEIDEILLVCCADNNMVRYRLDLAQHYLLNIPQIKQVQYIDSGNYELGGQVLYSAYKKGDTEFLEDGTIQINRGVSDTIFARMDDEEFDSKLSYADFELSCDVVAESAPQNIATNQMAGYYVIEALTNKKSYKFNSFTGFGDIIDEVGADRVQIELNKMVESTKYQDEIANNQTQISLTWR